MKIPDLAGRIIFTLGWPFLYLYLRIGERTRLLLVVGNEVLLVRGVLGNESWGLPGGGLHHGEDPTLGVLREAHEEIGVELGAEELRSFGKEPVTTRGLTYTCHYFAVELPRKPPLHLQTYEIAAARWVDIAELGTLSIRNDVRRAVDLWANR